MTSCERLLLHTSLVLQPQYVTMPGWQCSIEDVREYSALHPNAKAYVEKIAELVQVPGQSI